MIRLEQNYRSTPHILAAASGLIAANESRLGKTLWTDLPERREGPPDRPLGRRGGGALDRRGDRGATPAAPAASTRSARRHRHPGARLLPDARLRGALPDHRPPLPRHRRPALLRAPGDPRRHGLLPRRRLARRRPRLRAHRQRPQARHRRQGGAGAQPRRPRQRRLACSTPPACSSRDGGLPARARTALGQLVADFDRWHAARPRRARDHVALAETHPRGERLHRHVARPRNRPTPPAGSRTSRSWSRRWTSSRTCRASSSTSRWSWTTSRRRAPPRSR